MSIIKADDLDYDSIIKQVNSARYRIYSSNNFTCIYDNRKHIYGISRCHPDDVFDWRIGI